jgi:hypothetical protein
MKYLLPFVLAILSFQVNALVGDLYECESEKYLRFITQGVYKSQGEATGPEKVKNFPFNFKRATTGLKFQRDSYVFGSSLVPYYHSTASLSSELGPYKDSANAEHFISQHRGKIVYANGVFMGTFNDAIYTEILIAQCTIK